MKQYETYVNEPMKYFTNELQLLEEALEAKEKVKKDRYEKKVRKEIIEKEEKNIIDIIISLQTNIGLLLEIYEVNQVKEMEEIREIAKQYEIRRQPEYYKRLQEIENQCNQLINM